MTASSVLTAFLDVAFFRMLPLLAYAAATRRSRPAERTLAVLALAAIAVITRACGVGPLRIASALSAICYVAATALVVRGFSAAVARQALTRGGLMLACLVIYLLLPGLVLPAPQRDYFLVLGWEAALAAYSFAVEAPKAGPRSVRECVFFLVVNPLLVYTPRARLAVHRDGSRRPLARAGLGLMVMALAIVLSSPRALPWAATLGALQGYSAFLVNGALVFVARYAALSGLASLQIGALGALGYALPERYHYPFLATSPLDFFRRWNVYVGDWFKQYVFHPLGLRLLRSPHRLVRRVGVPVALAATMLLLGVFHDLFVYASELRVRQSGTIAFTVAALAMVAWILVDGLASRLGSRLRAEGRSLAAPVGRLLSHAVVLHAACAVLWAFTRN